MTRLTIHGRVHLGSDGKVTTSGFTRCPESGRWSPVEACRKCPRSTSVDATTVTCAPEHAPFVSLDPARAPISEVMDAKVLCIDSDATAEAVLRTLDEQDAPIAVVVDGGRHAIGVCSRHDLVHRAPSCRVETCMTPFVITMLDNTTVADAVDLVSERDLHHVPVLSDGQIVGIVTPRAVIRWLAQNLRRARRPRRPRGVLRAKAR